MTLDKIKKLIEAATPGIANGVMFQDEFEPPTFEVYTENDGCLGKFERQADADLFQASRTLMPKLVRALELADKVIEAMKCMNTETGQGCDEAAALESEYRAALESDE